MNSTELLAELKSLRLVIESRVAGDAIPPLCSVRSAARLLGVSASRTLAPLIRSGQLRVVSLGGSRYRIPREEIQRLMRDGIPDLERRARKNRPGGPVPSTALVTAAEMVARLKARGL